MSRPLLLYVNLGSPPSPSVDDVQSYLREFLSDPFVVDTCAPLRWALAKAIAKSRAHRSSRAYSAVWGEEGSPLLVHSKKFIEKLKEKLKGEADVELVMRYGEPSIRSVLRRALQNKPSRIVVMPAYPQYALSSTETAFAEIENVLRDESYKGEVRKIPFFYKDANMARAIGERVKTTMKEKACDHLLFSFHGLPKRHIRKLQPDCEFNRCCFRSHSDAPLCYRRQCFATAMTIADEIQLTSSRFHIGFQSRLGWGWIQPFSDHLYVELAKRGVRRLAVVCPSFTADCLETVEEVALRGRETFRQAGGEDLFLVPCMNDAEDWVAAAAEIFKKALAKGEG